MSSVPSPVFQKMHDETQRRMCAAADEILRSDWPAYGEAARPGRVSGLDQLLRDMENLAMLGKPELIEDYLAVMGETEYGGIKTPRDQGHAIALKLIARRREIELEVIDTADLSGLFPRATPPTLKSSILTRIVVGVAVVFFGVLALSYMLFPPATASIGEKVGVPLTLLAIDALMIWLIFFNGRIKGVDRLPLWKGLTSEEEVRRRIRKDVEKRYGEL